MHDDEAPIQLPPVDPARRYPLSVASLYLDLSPVTLWRRERDGELRTIKDGRRKFVSGAEILRLSGAAA